MFLYVIVFYFILYLNLHGFFKITVVSHSQKGGNFGIMISLTYFEPLIVSIVMLTEVSTKERQKESKPIAFYYILFLYPYSTLTHITSHM